MWDLSLIFSILFFCVCSVSLFWGLYITSRSSNVALNRTFFALCMALCVWSFGFSVAISAPDLETSLFWRRTAALGWGSFFAVLMHFTIILTEKNSLLKKTKWWLYILLYFPAAVTIYVFAFPHGMDIVQFNLVETPYGWVNITDYGFWDWFYNMYYMGYTICVLALIWNWGRQSSSTDNKKMVRIILFSFAFAFLAGTLTDMIFSTILMITIPQIAPLILLIPLATLYFSIKRYGLLPPKPQDDNEMILTAKNRMWIYNYLSIAAIAGALLNYVSQYLADDLANLTSVLSFSIFLIFLGILLQIVQRMKLSSAIKHNFTVILLFFAIPVITLWFIEYASITVWAFPFILIIFSLVFNRPALLIAIAISTIMTQIIIWIFVPQAMVEIKGDDYIVRIGIFALGIWLASYVNKAYILRLKENDDQIRSQRLISEISSDFIAVNRLNIDMKTNNTLEQMGRHFQADRIYVSLFDAGHETFTCTHEWLSEGTASGKNPSQILPAHGLPWLTKHLMSGVVHVPDVEALPDEAREEKTQFMGRHIQSLLTVPIVGSEKIFGFLGLDMVAGKMKWHDVHINLLKIIANIFADALTKVEAEKEINAMALYDHLTRLPNRVLFKDRAAQAIERAKRKGNIIGVIFLDLDFFKNVNDTMGHERGDELLIDVSRKLSQCVRACDTVSRFGGDEFLILINDILHPQDLLTSADRIMALFSKPFLLKGQEFFITASAGLAVYPIDGADTEMLTKNADIAMYKAKEMGKNQYVLCSSEMKSKVQEQIKLSNSLYRAQERGELLLYYQPQISLKHNTIIGLEALLRWLHPEMGMILPGVFIPLAEHTGLINPIGEWVLKTACTQNKMWQDMGLPSVRMAVNISVHQLRNPNFVAQIGNVLKETGLNPKFLELEITESGAINEQNYIIDVLSGLKQLGVSISIDDFGTEYSSLSRLKILPIDRIKMDMQFVQGIDGSDKDKAITKIIIHLAQNLGLKVIAEGVETKHQMEFLTQRMCDEVQGFYYYRPMPAEEAEKVLKAAIVQQSFHSP